MNIGDRIVRLRETNNVSRKDLAEYLKIPYTTLRNYETNDREPGHKTLIAIADRFGVSVDSLLGYTPKEKESSQTKAYSKEEQEHIKKYRALDEHGKEAVDGLLDIEYRRTCAQTESKE